MIGLPTTKPRLDPTGLPAMDDDAARAAAALAGDNQAFNELVVRHQAGVIGLAYRLCGERGLAEEIAQEAFLRAWQRLQTYKPQYSFRNWLYSIAAHLACDHQRQAQPLAEADLDAEPAPGAGPEDDLQARQRIEKVRQSVLALPPASRAVLVLREYEGLAYAEIASVLDIPLGTVMSRLNYARSQLRSALKQELEAL